MYPLPEHFLVRPGEHHGVIVPLIAVDQLPDWIQLAGVPRELDAEEAIGLTSLGIIDREDKNTYEVCLRTDKIRAILNGTDDEQTLSCSASEEGQENEIPDPSPERRQDTVKAEAVARRETPAEKPEAPSTTSQAATSPKDLPDESGEFQSASLGEPARPEKSQKPDKQHGDKRKGQEQAPEPKLLASRHNVPNVTTDDKPPARKEKPIRPHLTEEMRDRERERSRRLPPVVAQRGVKDKSLGGHPDTIYCRHWCHHGTCKWGWECRYQHRMPTNQEGLREVGLKDFPTWYLLLMGTGGFPSSGGNMALGGMNTSLNTPMAHTHTHTDLLSGLGRASHAAGALRGTHARPRHDTQLAQQVSLHHPSPMDLRLMQGRMSALLSGSTAMSNRQKLRQIKEMRDLLLRNSAASAMSPQPLPLAGTSSASLLGAGIHGGYSRHHQGRANLHTNASLAANAAGLSAASRRQAAREADRGANAPVEIPAAGDGRRTGRDGSVGQYDELEGRLSPVSSDGAAGEEMAGARHEKLVDVD